MLNVMKIRPGGAELFHADRQKNVMDLTVSFRKFENAFKNIGIKPVCTSTENVGNEDRHRQAH
jgi:hypothetical protein